MRAPHLDDLIGIPAIEQLRPAHRAPRVALRELRRRVAHGHSEAGGVARGLRHGGVEGHRRHAGARACMLAVGIRVVEGVREVGGERALALEREAPHGEQEARHDDSRDPVTIEVSVTETREEARRTGS